MQRATTNLSGLAPHRPPAAWQSRDRPGCVKKLQPASNVFGRNSHVAPSPLKSRNPLCLASRGQAPLVLAAAVVRKSRFAWTTRHHEIHLVSPRGQPCAWTGTNLADACWRMKQIEQRGNPNPVRASQTNQTSQHGNTNGGNELPRRQHQVQP